MEDENVNEMSVYCDPEASFDDSILNILDELHNNSDLDSSMLHASKPQSTFVRFISLLFKFFLFVFKAQLNEEEKEDILKDNLQMTQVQMESLGKKLDQSLNNSLNLSIENEQFLNDLNKSRSSSSSNSCDTSLQDEPKKSNVTLIEELINSSEDEKVYEKKRPLSPTGTDIERIEIGQSIHSSHHNCSYFETQRECSHIESSISQIFCIKCDHVSEIKDSLDYMAFTSPVKNDLKLDKNWSDLLKFNSPSTIVQDNNITHNKIDENHEEPSQNQFISIIDETITDTSNYVIHKKIIHFSRRNKLFLF